MSVKTVSLETAKQMPIVIKKRKKSKEMCKKDAVRKISIGAKSAYGQVRDAILKGNLRSLSKEYTKCTDCDKRAIHYDHRDYNKPLEVEPVCTSCNRKRGPAKPKDKHLMKHSWHKLNFNLAIEIRICDKCGLYTRTALAKKFGVSEPTISLVLNNRIWR